MPFLQQATHTKFIITQQMETWKFINIIVIMLSFTLMLISTRFVLTIYSYIM